MTTQPNPVLEALKHTTTLARVKTKALGLTRIDRTASNKVNADNGAISKAASVNVNRLAGADVFHKNIVSIQGEAKALLQRVSQPFGEEDVWRMLPNMQFEKFVRDWAVIKQNYDKAIEQLISQAPHIIERAKENVGSFNIEVPTIEEMKDAYGLQADFMPIPDGANFRGLDENTIEKLRQRHDKQLESAVHIAERDTLERFVDPLERFIDRMKAYNEREASIAGGADAKIKTGIFRDTVVTNIKELHDMLGSFNITGNPKLTQLGNDLAELAGTKPDKLRESETLRTVQTARAQEVAETLKGWLTP